MSLSSDELDLDELDELSDELDELLAVASVTYRVILSDEFKSMLWPAAGDWEVTKSAWLEVTERSTTRSILEEEIPISIK